LCPYFISKLTPTGTVALVPTGTNVAGGTVATISGYTLTAGTEVNIIVTELATGTPLVDTIVRVKA